MPIVVPGVPTPASAQGLDRHIFSGVDRPSEEEWMGDDVCPRARTPPRGLRSVSPQRFDRPRPDTGLVHTARRLHTAAEEASPPA